MQQNLPQSTMKHSTDRGNVTCTLNAGKFGSVKRDQTTKHSTHKGNVTCTFLCLHKFEPYLYSLSQTWHLNGFSSKWLRRCLLISCFVENGLWQIPQAWRFSPWTSENKFHFSQLMQRNYTYNTNDLKEHFAHLYDVACGHSNWAKASISHRFHTV